jgi:hypothetical protein
MVLGAVVGPVSWAMAAGSLAHDAVARLSGSVNAAEARFLPVLEVVDGCQPYAAVQDDGSYSGGIEATGSETGACKGNGSGQTIVRSRCEDSGICAYMYALYFPKDQGMVNGVATPGVGHRHEWENVVVWVRDEAVVAVSFSQHSGYEIKAVDQVTLRGSTVSVQYGTGGDTTHSFRPSSGGGSPMPSPVSLDSITSAARSTFNVPDTWGGIDYPGRDDNFVAKLTKARPAWL